MKEVFYFLNRNSHIESLLKLNQSIPDPVFVYLPLIFSPFLPPKIPCISGSPAVIVLNLRPVTLRPYFSISLPFSDNNSFLLSTTFCLHF